MAAHDDQPWLDRPARILLAAIVALGLVRVVLAASIGLTDDEAYYRLWALAPAWGYLDHPPMVGWMIAAGRWIAGDTPLGIRLCAVLTSLLGPLVLWRSAHILFGPAIARRAVWVALAMPLMAVGGIIITPDTPSVLFWGLAAWALAELHVTRNANWWLAVGAFAGLGLLSKYTNLFVGAGILLWLVWGPGNLRWLRSWQLWAGGALAALLAAPVVLWNAQHEWASFAKQFGRAGRGQGWTLTYLAELIGAFAGLASPLIAVLAVAGLVRAVSTAVRERNQAHILLVSGSVSAARLFPGACAAQPGAAQLARAALSCLCHLCRHRDCGGHQRMAAPGRDLGGAGGISVLGAALRACAASAAHFSLQPRTRARRRAAGPGWRRSWMQCAARTAPAGSPPPATPPPDSSPITCAGKPRSRSSTSRCATSTCRLSMPRRARVLRCTWSWSAGMSATCSMRSSQASRTSACWTANMPACRSPATWSICWLSPVLAIPARTFVHCGDWATRVLPSPACQQTYTWAAHHAALMHRMVGGHVSEFVSAVVTASRWLREQVVTLVIVAGGIGLLGACVFRYVAYPDWTAGEALEALWPLYLAGALSLVLGWLIEREAT